MKRLTAERHDIQSAILSIAAESNMGLLVMGGYGHTRIAESLWGGATTAMLADSPVPLFLAR